MKGIAGPVMMLVVVLGFFAHRAFSGRDVPPRDFLDLELAGADTDRTGSCYALSTVLVANGWWGNVPRHWESTHEDVWTFVVEEVQQGYSGPVLDYQKLTFEKRDGKAQLIFYDASRGRGTDVDEIVDRLLEDPNHRKSTPVDRCRAPGAQGYHFAPQR